MPVDYIAKTRGAYPDQPPYQWSKFDTSPWTPMTKPLSRCRISIVSSGGVHLKSQPPFDGEKNDLTFREIPKNVDVASLMITHNHYDHRDADRDVNCIFPIERFRDLEKEGFIGELAPTSYTLMGRIFRRTALLQEMAPYLLRRLKEEAVDALFMVPA
ncbi:MAG: hypothetical protein HYU86_10740 [Chloroflexi bacterium]|nr:hypothetical protein [Chloroflexota bacterium]